MCAESFSATCPSATQPANIHRAVPTIWAFLQVEADGIAFSRLVALFASRQVKEHIGAAGVRNDKAVARMIDVFSYFAAFLVHFRSSVTITAPQRPSITDAQQLI